MPTYDEQFLEETIGTALGDPENYHVPMGIVRYDYANAHGWWVRLHRDEVQFQQMFWDSHYPSISEALRAAVKYRHEVLSSFPLEKKVSNRSFKALSTSPEERIHRRTGKGKRKPYEYWESCWYDENHKLNKKNFSVNKYGEEEARRLALRQTIENHNRDPKPLIAMAIADPYAKQKFKTISREDVEVLSTINSGTYKGSDNDQVAVEESYPKALEGGRRLELHLSIERDRKLRDAKVRLFLQQNGAIFCELCKLQFTKQYPFLSADLIEVHHIVPLSKLSAMTETRLEDLMLLCPNCHTAVHQGDEEENLLLAMEHFEKAAKTTNQSAKPTP